MAAEGSSRIVFNMYIVTLNIPFAYKFSQDVCFANVPHLTIFAILISRMAACSCKLVPYAYKFPHFHFLAKFAKSRKNLYAYNIYLANVTMVIAI